MCIELSFFKFFSF